MSSNQSQPWSRRRFLEDRIRSISGMKDISGLEIASSIGILANIFDAFLSQVDEHHHISGPRWFLLMRLLDEESHGNQEGITPTMLSQARNVSKNTISALLRGLEDQELIERNLDKSDRRIFRIRLTEKGREITKQISPLRLLKINNLANGLKKDEREQLIRLLGKLIDSTMNDIHLPAIPI